MTRIKLIAAAAIAPLLLGACATASLSETEEAMVEQDMFAKTASKQEIAALNNMTSIYIDAAALYKDAAELPDENNGIKPVLISLAKERNAFREMLQDRVIMVGGDPDEYGEALGTGHRAFTDMRTVFDKDSEVAVEEVLRGERYIVDEINKAMTDLPLTQASYDLLVAMKADAKLHITQLEAIDKAV